MNCEQARELLMGCNALAIESLPGELRHHISGCERCAAAHQRLLRLERAVRELPDPQGLEQSQRRFEKMLESRVVAKNQQRTRRFVLGPVWVRAGIVAVAAMLLVAIGAGLWRSAQERQEEQRVQLLSELTNWSLDVAQAPSPDQRKQLLNREAEAFRTRVAKAHFSTEERTLADSLMEGAELLVTPEAATRPQTSTEDVLAQAHRYHRLAGMVLDRMEIAAKQGRPRVVVDLGRVYFEIMHRGANVVLERARAMGLPPPPLDGRRPGFRPPVHPRLRQILMERAALRHRLHALVRRCPPIVHEELRRALRESGEGVEPDEQMN